MSRGRVASSVAEVIAGEAGGRTRAARYNDMRHIASVIANRARQLGVTPEQVVQRQSEFNAYGKRMPGGTAALVGLAEDALREVETAGPVTDATFYATPAAKGNLPKGLARETKTASHVYFSDPKGRAIYTSAGLKTPAVDGRAALGKPFDTYNAASLPTPTPRDVTLAAAMPSRPVTPTPAGLLSPTREASVTDRISAGFGGLLGITPAAAAERSPGLAYGSNVPSPAAPQVPGAGLLTGLSLAAMNAPAATPTGNERARSAITATLSAPTASGRMGRVASLPAPQVSAAVPMNPARAANVSSRIDAGFAGTPAPLGAGAFGSPIRVAAPTIPTSGGLLTDAALASMRTPGPVSGNERAAGLYTARQLLDADVADRRRQMATPAPQVQAPPVAPVSFSAPAIDAAQAAKTSRLARTPPALAALLAPVTIAAAPRVAAVDAAPRPAALDTRPRSASTGLGLPDVPAQPQQPGLFSQGGLLDRNRGTVVGGILGSAAAGPFGGLVGGLLGKAVQNARLGTPSAGAQAALRAGWDGVSAMTPPQVEAANPVERRSPVADMPALSYAPSPSTSTSGIGLPSIPAAPAPGGFFSGPFSGNGAFTARRNGAIAGGLLGASMAGPMGGLLGALAGRALVNSSYGSPSHAAQAALDSGWDGFGPMTSAQSDAARNAPAGGGSAAWGGGGGLLGGIGGFFGGIGNALGGLLGSGGAAGGGGVGAATPGSYAGGSGGDSQNHNTSPSKSSGSSKSGSGKKK